MVCSYDLKRSLFLQSVTVFLFLESSCVYDVQVSELITSLFGGGSQPAKKKAAIRKERRWEGVSEWTFAVDIREFFPAPFQQLSQCHTTSSLVIDWLYCICVSLIYTLICVSTIGFVNISFKIIKESQLQLVYFKFLNMIYCCFSQSLSVADLEPVRSGVFFCRIRIRPYLPVTKSKK